MFGHVYNGQYQQFFDLGKSEYFSHVLKSDCYWNEQGLVMANTNNTYITPTYPGEKIVVSTRISKIGNKSITIEQEMVNIDTNEVKATSTSIVVGYNGETKETIVIPDEWRTRIARHEGW